MARRGSKTKKPKRRLKVEWVDDGKPMDLTITKGESKNATYIVRVTDSNNRPVRADEAWISRIRRKQLIDYSGATVEAKRNGIAYVSFTYRTNKDYEDEDDAQAKVRMSAEGHLDGLNEFAPYKEKVLSPTDL